MYRGWLKVPGLAGAGVAQDVGGIIGSVAGGLIGGDSASDAAEEQGDASRYASDIQKQMYDQTREDQQPYLEGGYKSLDRLLLMLGLKGNKGDKNFGILTKQFAPGDLANDPGYQFQLAEGEKGINRAASANGMNLSGATLKALQKYGQGLASTTFGDAWNRNQASKGNIFNWLSGVSGSGQSATNQVGQAGANYATAAGNNAIGAANASAAATMAQGNMWANTANKAIAGWQGAPWYTQGATQPITQQQGTYTGDGFAVWGET